MIDSNQGLAVRSPAGIDVGEKNLQKFAKVRMNKFRRFNVALLSALAIWQRCNRLLRKLI
jgi:hypothetical protein